MEEIGIMRPNTNTNTYSSEIECKDFFSHHFNHLLVFKLLFDDGDYDSNRLRFEFDSAPFDSHSTRFDCSSCMIRCRMISESQSDDS